MNEGVDTDLKHRVIEYIANNGYLFKVLWGDALFEQKKEFERQLQNQEKEYEELKKKMLANYIDLKNKILNEKYSKQIDSLYKKGKITIT